MFACRPLHPLLTLIRKRKKKKVEKTRHLLLFRSRKIISDQHFFSKKKKKRLEFRANCGSESFLPDVNILFNDTIGLFTCVIKV